MPELQIWLEDSVGRRELPFILCHGYLERRLMRDAKLGYDRAHDIASALEFDLRKGIGKGLTPLLARGGKRTANADLTGLTDKKVYQFVCDEYSYR